MHSRMPASAYIDQAWFERERDLLFKPLWQFIGLKMMLEAHNGFITRTLCGVPIVVQNFDGELRAFENVCLHRQNPIQVEPQGVRPLVCYYHGWAYGSDGAPAKIPFEDTLYRYPAAERACMHLRRFALECVGNLVFVNLSAEPMPIRQQFGAALLASMAQSSLAYDGEVMMTTYEGKFNWKLAYENLRDSVHPKFLHTRSLYKEVKFEPVINEGALAALSAQRGAPTPERARALALLRSFSGGGRDTPIENFAHQPWFDHVERYRDQDWYYNWLAFPNLHIASPTAGYSFIIEQHVPVGPGRTDLIVHAVLAKKKKRFSGALAVLHGTMMGLERVLREDVGVLEDIQRTLHPGAKAAHLGDYEFINAGIEHWYLAVMEGKIVL